MTHSDRSQKHTPPAPLAPLAPTVHSAKYDGYARRLVRGTCPCGTHYYVPKHVVQRRKYCSRSCAQQGQRRSTLATCGKCRTDFPIRVDRLRRSRSGIVFCSRRCKDLGQRLDGCPAVWPSHYGSGRASYRRVALRALGAVCTDCGYKACAVLLDVHQMDGNRRNNALTNLLVVCVWCHAHRTRAPWIPKHLRSRRRLVRRS